MKNLCVVCGIEFESVKAAKTCSQKCRVTLSRANVTLDPNVTLAAPIVTPVFEFTIAHIPLNPGFTDKDTEKAKAKVRRATYWYDVPLAAIPKLQKGWAKMPDFMNGRQYFLWWKNEFKVGEDGKPIIHNPFPARDNANYVQAHEGSRRYGA